MNAAKPKRAAIYLRVSTDRQTVENQRIALTEAATRRGWQIVQEYSDKGISGTKDRAGGKTRS
jgi:DNA invertase Pin-like site-specific DNA recombinase